MLQKQKIDLNFLKGIDESVSQCVNTTISKAVNVVATKFGSLKKRWGYKSLGNNDLTIRSLAQHNRELVALSDEGVYKIINEKYKQISPAICSEVISEPIVRNVYNQSNPLSSVIDSDLVTVYYDSRGGYRVTAKDVDTNSFIARDVSLGLTGVEKLKLFIFGSNLFLFYVKISDKSLNYRQFERDNYTLLSEVAVQGVTVGDAYSLVVFNETYFLVGYIQGNDLKIGAHNAISGVSVGVADACPPKRTFKTDASTYLNFTFDVTAGYVTYYIVYLATNKIRFYSVDEYNTSLFDKDIFYFDNLHAFTSVFLDDRISIFYDKVGSENQEYLLFNTSIDYEGSGSEPTLVSAGLALASEAFFIKDKSFVACSYASIFQPSFYIVSEDAYITGKFNKDSGMPHKATADLSNVVYREGEVWFPMETRTRLDRVDDFYTQNYGVNIYKMQYGYETVIYKELETYTMLSGSIIRQYDGASLTEAGFLLRPDENAITLWQASSKAYATLSSGLGAIRITSEALGGNGIVVALTTGGTYGAEVVTVVGSTITVQIQNNVSTARSIVTAIQASVPAEALVDVDVITDGKMKIGATATTANGSGGSLASGTYQYQVVYSWTDNYGNVHRSAPSLPLSIATGASDRVQLKIPSLLLTEKDEIWIEIYRTEVDGTVFHLVNYVLNDFSNVYTYYVDSALDANIISKEIIYTAGGVLENDSFPVSSCLAIIDNRLIMANQDSGFVYYTKELKEGFGVSSSDYFYINTGTKGGKIIALKAFKDAVIVFKERSVGLITGQFATDTGLELSLKYDVISEEFGAVSKSAICEIDKGIIFQSYQGVSLIGNDFNVNYIGMPIEDKRGFVLKAATVLPEVQTIVFIGEETSYAFNYGKDIWSEFEGHNGFSAVTIFGQYYYLDTVGNVQKRDDTSYSDGIHRQPINITIGTPWIQLGNINGFERVYKVYFGGKLIEPTSFLVKVYYDFNETPTDTLLYTPTPKKVFGDIPYTEAFAVSDTQMFESICIYPSIQKCSSFMIEIVEFSPDNVPSAGIEMYGISIECGGKKGWYKQFDKHSVSQRS